MEEIILYDSCQRYSRSISLSQVLGDIDDLLDWFRDTEKQLQEADPITPDPYQLADMLREQKVWTVVLFLPFSFEFKMAELHDGQQPLGFE